MPAIVVERLSKTFDPRSGRRALDQVSLAIEPGELVALIGASGSGKSTLLRHVAGLVAGDRDGAGSVIRVLGGDVQRRGRLAPNLSQTRADIGVVFQQFNLVGRLSLLTNVLIGLLGRVPAWRGYLACFTRAEKLDAMEALDRVGMAEHASQRASTLSGGQQQRGAIARALLQRARVILADEPIASLDPRSARRVMELLTRINNEDGTTVIVSLHQVAYALAYCPRTVALRDGRVVFDGETRRLTPAFLGELYGAESEELLLPDMAAAAPVQDGARAEEGAVAAQPVRLARAG